ncbi:trypsin-like serine protease [Sorangium sp. So ce1000]|uniref:trypsin-like serine protease n=1 Tax=Sorangium sp. So ce1000 TaxID=3133325 RepID=UPI003F600E3C
MYRFTALRALFLALLPLSACALDPMDPLEEGVDEDRSAIVRGDVDTLHTAVVAVVSRLGACTGTLIEVREDRGFVLTAAHCCPAFPRPQEVVFGVDRAPPPDSPYPAPVHYDILPGSIQVDPRYDGRDHDFCLLQFSVAEASSLPAPIPLSTPETDDLDVGDTVEILGYGETEGDARNTLRRRVEASIDALDAISLRFDQVAPKGGACGGDSGGPALAGAAGAQRVAAVTWWGDPDCAQFGVSGRVAAAIEPFIAPYLRCNGPAPCDDVPCGPDRGGNRCDEAPWQASNPAASERAFGCAVGGLVGDERRDATLAGVLLAALAVAQRRRRTHRRDTGQHRPPPSPGASAAAVLVRIDPESLHPAVNLHPRLAHVARHVGHLAVVLLEEHDEVPPQRLRVAALLVERRGARRQRSEGDLRQMCLPDDAVGGQRRRHREGLL